MNHVWQFPFIEVFEELKVVEISDDIGKEEDANALEEEQNDGHRLQTLHTLFIF